MISSIANRVRETDQDGVLQLVAPIIDESGIVATLQRATPPRSPAGAPTKYGQYTARGVLIAMFHIAYAGRPLSLPELLKTLWFDYTDQQMLFIGMPGLRTEDRRNAIRTDRNALKSEHQRLWSFIQTLFAPMDDTPRSPAKRVSKEQGKKAQEKARVTLVQEATLRRTIVNDLITATIDGSLLSGWKGDLAIDEHVVNTSRTKGKYFVDTTELAGATPMASRYPRQNRVGDGWHVGLTRAVATSRPYGKRVPTICVALDIDKATAGNINAALNCVDEFDRRGLRPAIAKTDRQYLVTDQGYSRNTGFNVDLLRRGYSLLMHYAKDEGRTFDLSKEVDRNAQEFGPYLHHGAVVCPAARKTIRTPNIAVPSPTASARIVAKFEEQEERLAALTMPVNGLPEVTQQRKPGRPRKGDLGTLETVVKLRVKCPAVAGKVRCPVLIDDYLDPANRDLPDVGFDAPLDNPPKVCQSDHTTITFAQPRFRYYQPVMEGTWKHSDWMAVNRSRDEGFNNLLTSTEVGNLQDRALYSRRNPVIAMTIAFAVASTNLKAQDKWREVLLENGGVPPDESRVAIRAQRLKRQAA